MLWISLCWVMFTVPFIVNHLRVRRERGGGPARENRIRGDPRSNIGLILQALALGVAFEFRIMQRPALLPLTVLICAASTAFAWNALRHLGRQWRIEAVVTDDHEFVTTGAYRIVRHPVYLALFGMLVGTLVTAGSGLVAAVSVALFAAGTEIRVRAEDGLLRAAFPQRFREYAGRVRAWLPGVR